jgi:hypothetical protein
LSFLEGAQNGEELSKVVLKSCTRSSTQHSAEITFTATFTGKPKVDCKITQNSRDIEGISGGNGLEDLNGDRM